MPKIGGIEVSEDDLKVAQKKTPQLHSALLRLGAELDKLKEERKQEKETIEKKLAELKDGIERLKGLQTAIGSRETIVVAKEQSVQKREDNIRTKEDNLDAQEKEVKKRALDLAQREKLLEAQEKATAALQDSVNAREQSVDAEVQAGVQRGVEERMKVLESARTAITQEKEKAEKEIAAARATLESEKELWMKEQEQQKWSNQQVADKLVRADEELQANIRAFKENEGALKAAEQDLAERQQELLKMIDQLDGTAIIHSELLDETGKNLGDVKTAALSQLESAQANISGSRAQILREREKFKVLKEALLRGRTVPKETTGEAAPAEQSAPIPSKSTSG